MGAKNKYGRHVAIFEIKQKINGHTCWPSQAFSLHQVWKKSTSCCSSYASKCVYIQDGPQAAILNDIKNLFDVHNPQTIPDLGVKFQTIWSIHFWKIAVHGSTDVHTDGWTDGAQIINPQTLRVGWGWWAEVRWERWGWWSHSAPSKASHSKRWKKTPKGDNYLVTRAATKTWRDWSSLGQHSKSKCVSTNITR